MSIVEEKSGGAGSGSVGRRRRRWSEAQKRQVVADNTHELGVSVSLVAQRYNLKPDQIFGWRRLFLEPERAGGTGQFVPVVVEAAPGQERDAAMTSPPSESVVAEGQPATGRMDIVISDNRRAVVGRTVDGSALSRVIGMLERR